MVLNGKSLVTNKRRYIKYIGYYFFIGTNLKLQPFTDKAKKEREKYNKELAAYEAEQGITHPEKKAKTEHVIKTVPKAIPAKPTVAKVTKAKSTKAAPAPAKKAAAAAESSSSSDDDSEESSDSDSD